MEVHRVAVLAGGRAGPRVDLDRHDHRVALWCRQRELLGGELGSGQLRGQTPWRWGSGPDGRRRRAISASSPWPEGS